MPQITAWFCPHSNKLYRTKNGYIKHLKKLAQIRINNKKIQAMKKIRSNKFAEMRQLNTLVDIEQWILDNSDFIVLSSTYKFKPGQEFPKIKSIKFFNMKFTTSAKNTHCAPFGKSQNFLGHNYLPTEYCGWIGRVKFELSKKYPDFPTTIFNNSGINFGSGSGIYLKYASNVTLFALDWPGLSELEVLHKLSSD